MGCGLRGTKEMKTTPFCERVGRIFLLGEALCDMVQKEQLCRGPGKPMFIEETCLELHRVILGCFEYWTYLGSNTTEPGSNQQVFGDLRWISKVVSIALEYSKVPCRAPRIRAQISQFHSNLRIL